MIICDKISAPNIQDYEDDCDNMDDSSSGKVQAEELPVSPDDNEVVMQNKRPAKRSTFELDQPPVSVKAMRPSNGLPSKSKKRIN